jgi:hypothetical protein
MVQGKPSMSMPQKSGKNKPVVNRKPAGIAGNSDKQHGSICTNKDCKLRKAGCKGFEACPGYKGR